MRQNPPFDTNGVNIHTRDWDVLLVLDACRYDVFEKHCEIDGDLRKVWSRGSTSEEWVRGNFVGDYDDLVIVATNPFYRELADEVGLRVHHFEWVEPDDEARELTDPERVTDRVLEVAAEYPEKRVLAHYMQPHAPYLGQTGQEISFEREPLQKAISRNGVSQELVQKAYRENFEIVQEAIRPVIDAELGKTVITADHGELLGEPLLPNVGIAGFYGHPYGFQHEILRTVPWHVVPTDQRRTIRDGSGSKIDSADVGDQLEALGYL